MKNLTTLHDGIDRAAWLQARVPVITATQAAAIAGSHPYSKLIDVWNEKTDPNHDPDALRNQWLEERAAFGSAREPEIIQWASALPVTGGEGNPFMPSSALVTRSELMEEFPELPPAATPDGWKTARGGNLVLVEGKTTQQDWESNGLPQHIYDQCLWQMYATGAVCVWVAGERVEWVGRGKDKRAEVVGRFILKVQPDEARLAFLQERVAEFRQYVAEGIAPESDMDLRAEAGRDLDPFDTSADELADWAEAVHADGLLTELDELEREMAEKAERVKAIKAELAPIVKQYAGRRVHLIGSRRIIKLVRFYRTVENTASLPADVRRSITSWTETERVSYEPNPEYIAPEPGPTA